jgi:alpha-glucan,water dikinase
MFAECSLGWPGLHLAELKKALPPALKVPASVALPFGSFERCCAADVNSKSSRRIDLLKTDALAEENIAERRKVLDAIQAVVMELQPPEGLQGEVEAAAQTAALGQLDFEATWTAVQKVWASQWGERAWLSRRALGLTENQLRMSVLIQKVVPAKYAFVLHTANPLTGNTDEMLGEVVVGLGETLVSNTPGRALAFTCAADGGGGGGYNVNVISLPSKHTALYPPPSARGGGGGGGLIARSDSNAEDLEEFAGAGLYDSVMISARAQEAVIDYTSEPLLWDRDFINGLVVKLAEAGGEIQEALGGRAQVRTGI